MSQDIREKKLNQVRALFQLTVENGCTEQEARAAFLRAQKMMADWAMASAEVHELRADDEPCLAGEAGSIVKDQPWSNYLSAAIADNFRCKRVLWRVPVKRMRTVPKGRRVLANGRIYTEGETYTVETVNRTQHYVYRLFGEKSDVEMAVFLFDQAVNACRTLAAECADENFIEYPGCGTTRRKVELAYMEGFAKALYSAYTEAAKSDTALVLYRRMPQRVIDAYDAYSKEQSLSKVRGTRTSYASSHSNAYTTGQQDGRAFASSQKQTRGGRSTATRGHLSE